MIRIEKLNKRLTSKNGKYTIFDGLSIHIERGKVTFITGESGSGKTTLLNILSFLDHDYEAEFTFDNEKVGRLSERKRARIRRERIGFVFQNYALIPELTILENVMLPARLLNRSKREATERAAEVLQRVGITKDLDAKSNGGNGKRAGFWHKFPHETSGGQNQRIGIARALVHRPDIIFCDEPTGNLDDGTAWKIMQYLLKYQCEEGERTLVIVTHNRKLLEFADRHLELKKKEGQPSKIKIG